MNGFNDICITQVASTVLKLMGLAPSEHFSPPIPDVISAAKKRFQSPCDRVFMYNPDAVAQWVYELNRSDFAALEASADLKIPMLSVVPPVTPACFGSMYSGLLPAEHGIQRYEKPVLKVETIFDLLPKAGKKAAIVSTAGDSISKIFLGRAVDYFIYKTKEECNRKALSLIAADEHDLIVLYNGDFDHYMHRVSPEGERAKRALRENIATFGQISDAINHHRKNHRTALAFAPDHGCHNIYKFLGAHGQNIPSDMNICHFWEFLG